MLAGVPVRWLALDVAMAAAGDRAAVTLKALIWRRFRAELTISHVPDLLAVRVWAHGVCVYGMRQQLDGLDDVGARFPQRDQLPIMKF